MAMTQTNHVFYTFVASDFARQATTIKDPSSATYIKEGEIVVSRMDNTLLTTTAGTYTGVDKVKLVMAKNSGLFSSPAIDYHNLEFYKVTAYASDVNKIIYIGYNETSGNLENNVLVPGTEYEIDVRKLGLVDHYQDSYNTYKMFSYYNASAVSGEAILAKGLVKNGVDNFYNNVDGFIKVEMVTSIAGNNAGTTVSFVEGSKIAVASGAGHGITACNYIKDTSGATYYVESVSGVNIYLETIYQGTSCTITPKVIVDATTGNWGIRITGKDKYFDAGGKFVYDKPDFEIGLKNFNNSQVYIKQTASLGNGTWKEVAQLEWEAQDMEGQTSHTDYLMPNRKQYFVEGTKYDILVIKSSDKSTYQITGNPKSPFTIFVCIPISCTQGDAAGSSTVTPGVAKSLDLWLTANTGRTYNETANLT